MKVAKLAIVTWASTLPVQGSDVAAQAPGRDRELTGGSGSWFQDWFDFGDWPNWWGGGGSGTDRAAVALDFADLAMEWVRQSERGPTISTHFVMYVTAALFDAYAAFEDGTTGSITDLKDVRVKANDLSNSNRKKAQQFAMADAAFNVITELGETLIDQKFLEADDGEDAVERLKVLRKTARTLRQEFVNGLRLKNKVRRQARAVSNAVISAILSRVTEDGSNFENNFVDTTDYEVEPWISPVPFLTDPPTDYDFADESFVETFNTYNAELASQQTTTGFAQVNPKVADGTVRLTDTFQTLRYYGILPSPGPLTPQWGEVTPMTLSSSSQFRGEVVGPYDEQGNLNPFWVAEAEELVGYACDVQAGKCPTCRATAEYWELGDSTVYPPGWWVELSINLAREEGVSVKKALQMVFGTSLSTFDSGIAAWEMKYFYDTTRPFTAVNELFQGSQVCDWRGNTTANVDDFDHWRPYQKGRGAYPPFPDNPSGHSTFSTSSSVVLRNLMGKNFFDFTSESFASRFDTSGGFDGNPDNGNEDIALKYDTFSEAADAAGISRLFGGIHAMQGNIRGLEIGARIGHETSKYLRKIFGDGNIGLDPVNDVNNDIVFGSGGDDALLVAPCSQGGPVEVYGYYGADVLEFDTKGNCGPVSLFGGDGADTFRIGALATIQDYKTEDTIVLLREAGAITTSTQKSVTTVRVDGKKVVKIAGIYDSSDLNIVFETSSGLFQ